MSSRWSDPPFGPKRASDAPTSESSSTGLSSNVRPPRGRNCRTRSGVPPSSGSAGGGRGGPLAHAREERGLQTPGLPGRGSAAGRSDIIETRRSLATMVETREPLDHLITSPRRFTAETTFPRAGEIRLYDTTLRDGEQTPGVAFTPEQKYELAGMLSDAGIHIIDMGFPSAAPSERRAPGALLEGKKGGAVPPRPPLHVTRP